MASTWFLEIFCAKTLEKEAYTPLSSCCIQSQFDVTPIIRSQDQHFSFLYHRVRKCMFVFPNGWKLPFKWKVWIGELSKKCFCISTKKRTLQRRKELVVIFTANFTGALKLKAFSVFPPTFILKRETWKGKEKSFQMEKQIQRKKNFFNQDKEGKNLIFLNRNSDRTMKFFSPNEV